MFKSLKGHQALCDVLKMQILNKNPKKVGVCFTRNINADGSYQTLEQYPKLNGCSQNENHLILYSWLDMTLQQKHPTSLVAPQLDFLLVSVTLTHLPFFLKLAILFTIITCLVFFYIPDSIVLQHIKQIVGTLICTTHEKAFVRGGTEERMVSVPSVAGILNSKAASLP